MKSAPITNIPSQEERVRELERKLETLTLEIKQREEFLSVCAHDLRSPLGLIQTSLQMVLKAGKLQPMQEELLTRAKRQSVQAIQLIKDLLDVMSLEQGLKPSYELLGLDTLLKEFWNDHQLESEAKGIRFEYQNEIPQWRILGDADRLRQLLQNLFTNAVKFTDPKKKILLTVKPFQGRRRNDPTHPMVIVSIQDEGKGIPEGEIKKIFDRFSQVKGAGRQEGRGLGLTVAKQISNLHDGNVWVESQSGVGSTFHVLLPYAIAQGNLEEFHPKRILICEPSLEKRDAYYGDLAKNGYELFFANDGVDTLTYAFHLKPHFVILSELSQKLHSADVAGMLKTEIAFRKVRVLLAHEVTGPKCESSALYDEILMLPFTKEAFDRFLFSAQDK